MKLVPSFLKKLDQYLLLNRHVIWASRIHYVAFYAGIAWIINWGISHAIPLSFDAELADPISLAILTGIPAGIALLYWMYQANKFNLERGYGHLLTQSSRIRFLLYFAGILAIGMQPLGSFYFLQERIMNLAEQSNVEDDFQKLNEANLFYPSSISESSLDNIWPMVRCLTRGSNKMDDLPDSYYRTCDADYQYNYEFFEGNPHEWGMGFYTMAQKPEYSYTITAHYDEIREALTSPEAEKLAMMETYQGIMEKYGSSVPGSTTENLALFKEQQESSVSFEMKQEVERQMNHIYYYSEMRREQSRVHYFHFFGWPVVIAFALALMMQIYSAAGWKPFLLSAATTLLVSTATVALGVSLFQQAEPIFFMALMVYIASTVIAFVGNKHSYYKPIRAVSASFAGFFTPFLPFLAFTISNLTGQTPELALIAILAGCGLYALFTVPIFWGLQARLQALPRKS